MLYINSRQTPEKESLVAVESDMDDMSGHLTPTADQYFLLYFIMGVYFAPDLKKVRPHKSVFQRRAEGLPTYLSHQLAGSHIRTLALEGVYYYVLRNADESLVMKLPWLRQFFCGNLPAPAEDSAATYPQFDSLFPPKMHPKSRFRNKYDVLQNIAFINDPVISYIKPVDIARFKRLTGLKDFLLDRDDPLLQRFLNGDLSCNAAVQALSSEDYLHPSGVQTHAGVSDTRVPIVGNEPSSNILPCSNHSHAASTLMCNAIIPSPIKPGTVNKSEPRTIFLPSCPSQEDWNNIVAATKGGISLAGTVARGQVGPILGLIDIGECDDSYLFRVSLPGVKRDEREFSCEVENDGRVLIRGVTTIGERIVYRYSEAFEMQSQNLCPPGHFSISFNLPGPVDPHQFSGNFGTDGILEGIIMKMG